MEDASALMQSMVVVLARNANNIRPTVTFLERRGIAVKLVTNLNEAVELFSRKEANILLLSVNFPHPKVEVLPALMTQSFQIETILYAEDSERRTLSRLNSAKSKHVLFGPVSGPVVMMKVRQIEREMASVGDEQSKNRGQRKPGQNSENDNSNVSGVRAKSENARQERIDALMKALAEIEKNAGQDSLGDLKKSGETFIQKGKRAKFMSEVDSGAPSLEGTLSDRATNLRHGLDLGLAIPSAKPRSKVRLIMPSVFSGALRSDLADLSPAHARSSVNEEPGEKRATQSDEANPSDLQIIQRCLREALAIVAGLPNPLQAELSTYASASLVSLRTLNLTCSFLVSVAFAKQAAGEVFHRMEVAFLSLLRDHGIEFENEQVHSILLDNMLIVEKAFRASEYVLISQSQDLQIGVASVVAKNPVATVEPYDENMLSVNLNDIPLDEPVTFNVFLHLKRNQRYVRYLKVGATISATQVSRLSEDHPNVLLEENELEAYRRHYAAHAIQGPKRSAA